MPDIQVLIQTVSNLGLAVFLILISVYGIWKFIVPSVVKQLEDIQNYYITEIKSLRDEGKQDKKMLFDAFTKQTEASLKLDMTLDSIRKEMSTLSNDVGDLKVDITKLYSIIEKGEK